MKLAYWVYKRILLLLAAYGGSLASFFMFPHPSPWSVSSFIGEILFSPFKLLIAVILFIVGFLSYSLFVRDGVKVCDPRFYNLSLRTPRLLFLFTAVLSWVHLLFKGGLLAVLALGLALWYGIMDVHSEKYNR